MGTKTFSIWFRKLSNFLIKTFDKLLSMWFKETVFFAHLENILIAMLRDNDTETRNMGVTKVLALGKQIDEENESQVNCSDAPKNSSVCVFHVPTVNLNNLQ